MRRPGGIFWKWFGGCLLLAAGALGLCAGIISQQANHFAHTTATEQMLAGARLLGETVGTRLAAGEADEELDALCKRIGAVYGLVVRVTLIRLDGKVVGDSHADPALMESHATRPEVKQAIETGRGDHLHVSRTLGTPMRYLALRVGPAQAPAGVVRMAMSVEAIRAGTSEMLGRIWTVILIGACVLACFAAALARTWSRPVRRMSQLASSVSDGNLAVRIPTQGNDELADLGRAIAEMRDRLAEQWDTIDHQRQILESLLAQLREGVVVVSSHGRIVQMNPAAVRLLGLESKANGMPASFEHMPVQEVITNHQIRRMLLRPCGTGASEPDHPPGTPENLPIREAHVRIQANGDEIPVVARALEIQLPPLPSERGDDREDSGAAHLLVLTRAGGA